MPDEEPRAPTLAEDVDRAIQRLAHEAITDERLETIHAFDHLKSAREWLRRRDGA